MYIPIAAIHMVLQGSPCIVGIETVGSSDIRTSIGHAFGRGVEHNAWDETSSGCSEYISTLLAQATEGFSPPVRTFFHVYV